MLLSQKWLQEFVELDVTPREFANTMAMTGFCIGGYEREGDEIKDVVVGGCSRWSAIRRWRSILSARSTWAADGFCSR